MLTSKELAQIVKDFAEPKIKWVSKEKAQQVIDLLNSKNDWKYYPGLLLLEEVKKSTSSKVDVETLEQMARLNYPDNAWDYLPAVLIFLFWFVMLTVALT